jgi:N-acetylmuramoyl-L-alanine amidase
MTNLDPTPSGDGPRPTPPEISFNYMPYLGTVISVAILVATLFNFITPAGLFSANMEYSLSQAIRNQAYPQLAAPTEVPSANHIGIVAGHWGSDGGYVCPDGQTETDANLAIATFVRQKLLDQGYEVDLFKEFDSRLQNYSGLAVVSIHSGSCEFIDNDASGFTAVPSLGSRSQPEAASRLVNCVTSRFAAETGLRFINTTNEHLTSWHGFEEVNQGTPVVVMEAGFLNLDREFLTKSPATAAQGIVSGILCFVRDEDPTAQVTP